LQYFKHSQKHYFKIVNNSVGLSCWVEKTWFYWGGWLKWWFKQPQWLNLFLYEFNQLYVSLLQQDLWIYLELC